MKHYSLTVEENGAGERADSYLAGRLPELSRSAAQRLLDEGLVTLGGKAVKKNARLEPGDVLEVDVPEARPAAAEAEDIPIEVIYEDASLIVVNKPRGMVVHPAAGNPDGTLVNALLHHCGDTLSGVGGELRPGIVHRIDKDTSGLLVAAKTDEAHRCLSAQLKDRTLSRTYEAVVLGNIRDDSGTVDAPIGRNPKDRKKMAVTAGGRAARTHYRVIKRFGKYTYIECRLESGRTHQIRVHMAYIGHSVAGDPLYAPKTDKSRLEGQCLHAKSIKFIHPDTGKEMSFTAPLPEYFEEFLNRIGRENGEV
ncbi:MAG: RluA family pseudouridine synthase [Clostridia bacterium]|nr:RluA family pseudouridine synthase [Clostridia bacterium]